MTRDEELTGYILEGMARAIWARAYIDWASNVDPPPVFPQGATWDDVVPYTQEIRSVSLQAARELLEAIQEANPGRAVLTTFREQERRYERGGTQADRAFAFGGVLAQMSLGVRDPVPGMDLNLPTDFKVELDDEGRDLTWDGGMIWARQPYAATNPAQDWPSSAVQSLLFDSHRYSERQAKRWALDHGYKYGSVDTTANYHRLRQFEPEYGQPCRTVEFGHGIKAIVCAARNPAGKPLGIEVLVMEDDPKIQSGIARMVKQILTNPHIIFADNVGAAIADLEVHQFGLVVSDVHVRGARTGIDLFHHVQEMYPGLVDRFVFFTDDADAKAVHDRYLPKGVATAEDLKRVIRQPAGRAGAPPPPKAMSLADFAGVVKGVLPSIQDAPGPTGLPTGRFGDKVFIAAIWRALERQPGFRAMTLSQFKRKLVEANRAQLLDLARLDAQGDVDPEELEESEITDRGARFHVVTDRAVARPPAARRMPLEAFADTVLVHAHRIQRTDSSDGAMGRFGHKVFVSALWRDLSHDPRIHAMGQSGFKRELWEAHRAGLLELSRADLVGAMDAGEVAQSEIKQGNAEFHFVLDPQALPEALRPSGSAMSLDDFSRIVLEALPRIRQYPGSTGRPAGRFGDDKVFIAAVWRQIHDDPRLRGMTMDQFKRQLIVAQRKRLLNLARADLVGAMDGPEVAQSEIEDMGASFHFVLDPNG